MFKKKKKESIYVNQFWYSNTYYSLGSEWLRKSLERIPLSENYVFVNLSANAGYYEKDVYEKHKDSYNPTYYIGDIEASRLIDEKIESTEHFIYLKGDNNAAKMDVNIVPEKADVILDCKGALWHTIADKNTGIKELSQLLDNYVTLLKSDSSILLLDYYKISYVKYFFQNLRWTFKRYNKKQTIINCFGEESTYKYLTSVYGRKRINNILVPLDVSDEISYHPLSKVMNTAYITKKDLIELARETRDIPNVRVKWGRMKRMIKAVLLSLIVILLVLLLAFFMIIDIYIIVSIVINIGKA